MVENEAQKLRAAYNALGLGTAGPVRALFRSAHDGWCMSGLQTGALREPLSIPMDGLFRGSIPSHWEVTGAEVRRLKAGRQRRGSLKIIVHGVVRSRPPGTWEMVAIPFVHIWTLTGGQPVSVLSYLDGIELRRCAAG